jgi:hypothetical protein
MDVKVALIKYKVYSRIGSINIFFGFGSSERNPKYIQPQDFTVSLSLSKLRERIE